MKKLTNHLIPQTAQLAMIESIGVDKAVEGEKGEISQHATGGSAFGQHKCKYTFLSAIRLSLKNKTKHKQKNRKQTHKLEF